MTKIAAMSGLTWRRWYIIYKVYNLLEGLADFVVVALGAVAGDHLADKSGEEKLEAEQHCH